MNLNRKHRDLLATQIRRLLNQDITATEYEDLTDDLFRSDDQTVNSVFWEVIAFCDHLKLDYLSLRKPNWNYIQRLLLLLDSDMHWEKTNVYVRSKTQIWAAFGLLIFIMAVISLGWTLPLLFCFWGLGVYSIILGTQQCPIEHPIPNIGILYPFHDLKTLEKTYVETTAFAKQKFPSSLYKNCAGNERVEIAVNFLVTVLSGPMALAFQLFPASYPDTKVVPRYQAEERGNW